MPTLAIKQRVQDLNRLRKIVTIVFEAGGQVLIEKIRLNYLVPWSRRIRYFFKSYRREDDLFRASEDEQVVSAKILREVLEKLGPTFIKLGQVLSLRTDIVGEKISEELSKLQSEVKPFPYEEVRRIITEELKQAPERIFGSIEKKPIAAASLAQVHRARLKDGTEVAVKVQRPQIRSIIEQDIHILFYLAHLIERFVPELRSYRLTSVVKEFSDSIMRELDFKQEGNNAERFRFVFKKNRHINIPRIFWDYTTPRVLTMDFVHGVRANDLEGIRKLGNSPRKLALYGVGAVFQQFLIDGFFHADPHPGNYFALKGDVLCLHDFGMVGYLTREQRKELVSCFLAFVAKDIDSFFKHFVHLASVSDKSDMSGFKKDVSNILSEFFFSSKQSSVAWAFFKIINKGAKSGIVFPADLALFGKALITTEAMGLRLYPEFNFNKELRPFVQRALKFYFDPRQALQAFKTDIFDYLEFFKTLPERAQTVLSNIEKGELSIKIDSSEMLEVIKEFNRQNAVRILGTVVVAVIIVTGILLHLEGFRTIGNLSLGKIGLAVSAALSIWFIVKLRKSPK
jgi:ubiquinone biosynthesis protein